MPVKLPQKTAGICSLSLAPLIFTNLEPSLSIVHVDAGTKWIPVWSQFSTSLGGASSMVATYMMSSKQQNLRGCVCFFAVVAFLLTNIIQLNRWYAHCWLNSMWPPNLASCVPRFLEEAQLSPCQMNFLFLLHILQVYQTWSGESIANWLSFPTSWKSRHCPPLSDIRTWRCQHELLMYTYRNMQISVESVCIRMY